ncbi:AI-2E family transporter [soil metagenome]
MAEKSPRFRMNHPVIVTFLIFAIIAFMYFTAEVLQPLALALLFSLILTPVSEFLERRGLPRVPAVFLTVLVVLGSLGGVGYVVYDQLNELGIELAENQDRIKSKFQDIFQPGSPSAASQLSKMADEISREMIDSEDVDATAEPVERQPTVVSSAYPGSGPVQQVEIVNQPSFQERLQRAVGPILQPAAIFGLVLILVLFIMMNREDLLDRIIQTFGLSQISMTTRTLEEAGRRVGRYLAIFTLYNSTCGLILGTGLYLIGIPYAVLWGFLAAVLRFIPYVGPWSAFALPLIYSIAFFEGWQEPVMVIVLFLVLEAISNGFLEPIIYGRTAGITAVGLLTAAMFWTWLWGPLGLLLSTPLTTCLAVLGKYVPGLRFFATMLGEESTLEHDVRFYQRLLALDQDGAVEIVEEALEQKPRDEVFDQILIPTLARSERDHARKVIEESEREFVWRVVRDILDELEGSPELGLDALTVHSATGKEGASTKPFKIVGVATNDTADAPALRMLGQLIEVSGCELKIIAVTSTPLEVVDQVAEEAPDLVLLSHLPPVGLTVARYLARKLRASSDDRPLWVGRWGDQGDTERVAERLKSMGANRVVFSLDEARDRILDLAHPKPQETGAKLVKTAR